MPNLRSQLWVLKILQISHRWKCCASRIFVSMQLQIRSMRTSPHPSLTKPLQTRKNLAISTQKQHHKRVVLTPFTGNFGCWFISDPQPDMAWNLFQAAICVQNVGVHVSCSSHVCTQLAAFFIDPRAEWSTTRGWYFKNFNFLYVIVFNNYFRWQSPPPSFIPFAWNYSWKGAIPRLTVGFGFSCELRHILHALSRSTSTIPHIQPDFHAAQQWWLHATAST